MSWTNVIGRVAFTNCDPLFLGLSKEWTILPAPPAWLTGHVLRRDCITAPIPAADYAKYSDELLLIPDLGIVARGAVGSVILFGSRPLEKMRDIALPSDSSTSKVLLRWLLKIRGLDPKCIETGPDLDSMLSQCDGALLIGDRALSAAFDNPELIRLDLGGEWTSVTGLPMVFGVFACRKDAPKEYLRKAHRDLIQSYSKFNKDESHRNHVIIQSSKSIGADEERMRNYFQNEVMNTLDEDSKQGLLRFLIEVCELNEGPKWVDMSQE
tara:strand:+ start:56101 stop:56904 length:804 start_codon:yes stop_codon:yes gene_type:complete